MKMAAELPSTEKIFLEASRLVPLSNIRAATGIKTFRQR